MTDMSKQKYVVRVCVTDLRTGKPLEGYPRALGPFDDYESRFLPVRRKMMAAKIRKYYEAF